MSAYTLWIEMDEAKIFKMGTEGSHPEILRRHGVKHHTHSDGKNHKDCEKFFHEIASSLTDATEILLVGPGLAKEHFKKHLENHHHLNLAKRVVGIKSLDIMTDAQILAASREFFKKYDVFGSTSATAAAAAATA